MMMTLISSAEQTTASVVDDASTEPLNYIMPLFVCTFVSPCFSSVYQVAGPLLSQHGIIT